MATSTPWRASERRRLARRPSSDARAPPARSAGRRRNASPDCTGPGPRGDSGANPGHIGGAGQDTHGGSRAHHGPPPEPPAAPESVSLLIEQDLAGRFKFIEKHMSDAFDGIQIELGDFEFEFDSASFEELNDVQNWVWLSEEERKDIAKAKQDAMEIARGAMSHAKANITRAQRDSKRARRDQQRTQRDAERAKDRAERDRERAYRHAEHNEERAERDFERSNERAEARAEQTERYNRTVSKNVSEQELLTLRQKALEKAQAELESELKEIKRQRANLEREKRKVKSN